jgi:hypothetical protein
MGYFSNYGANVRLKILPPWSIYIKMFEALFDGDPQIACNTNYSGDAPSIILSCSNGDKVTALQKILPEDGIKFGTIQLQVIVDGTPSNKAFANKKELFETAFAGNPAFAYAVCPVDDGYNWFSMVYVVFKNCVVQFFADNINDCHGVISCLYQDIAEKLLMGEGAQGVCFNTDIERGSLGKPLGEWP